MLHDQSLGYYTDNGGTSDPYLRLRDIKMHLYDVTSCSCKQQKKIDIYFKSIKKASSSLDLMISYTACPFDCNVIFSLKLFDSFFAVLELRYSASHLHQMKLE